MISAKSPTGLNTNTPTFSWVAQGGSTLFPNNRFCVVFLNSNYNTILTTNYTSDNNIQLSSSEWTQIQNASSPVYYYVVAKQTSNTETGVYYSTLKTLN